MTIGIFLAKYSQISGSQWSRFYGFAYSAILVFNLFIFLKFKANCPNLYFYCLFLLISIATKKLHYAVVQLDISNLESAMTNGRQVHIFQSLRGLMQDDCKVQSLRVRQKGSFNSAFEHGAFPLNYYTDQQRFQHLLKIKFFYLLSYPVGVLLDHGFAIFLLNGSSSVTATLVFKYT